MDNFNKVISFVLGLVVVVVLLVILTGRFNLREKFLPLKDTATKTTPAKTSPTPTSKATAKGATGTAQAPAQTKGGQPLQKGTSYEYHAYNQPVSQQGQTKGGAPTATTIPQTGPGLLIPFALTALLGGAFLRKSK
jgi:hypothetical protein